MSPPAVEVASSIPTSTATRAPPNPNPTYPISSSSGNPSTRHSSSRTRPRMTKLRRPPAVRSATSDQAGFGFNPFKSGSGSEFLKNLNNGVGATSVLSGFGSIGCDNSVKKSGFVFSAGNGGNLGGTGVAGNGVESARIGSEGLVFGGKENNIGGLKWGIGDSNTGNVGTGKEVGNSGFEFGYDKGDADTSLKLGRGSCGVHVGTVGAGDGGDGVTNSARGGPMGFVFGANKQSKGVAMEPNVSGEKPFMEDGVNTDGVMKSARGGAMGFVFGANKQSNGVAMEPNVSGEKPFMEDGVNMDEVESESGKFCSVNSEFSNVQSDLLSTLNMEDKEIGEDVQSNNTGKVESGISGGSKGHDDGLNSVFGASWSRSSLNFSFEEGKCAEIPQKRASINEYATKPNIEKESSKLNDSFSFCSVDSWIPNEDDDDVFIIGSGCKKFTRSVSPSRKVPDNVSSYGDNTREGDSSAKGAIEDFGSNVVFQFFGDVASASSARATSKLPEEMKNLNINDTETIDCATDKLNECTSNSSDDIRSGNVFKGSGKGSGSIPENSGFTFGYCNTSNNKCWGNVGNGNAARPNSGFSSMGSNIGQVLKSEVKDSDQQSRPVSSPCSYSSISCQQSSCVPDTPNSSQPEKTRPDSSAHTFDWLGSPFSGLKVPGYVPSISKETLFSDMGKIPESSISSRSVKDKRSKKKKGKVTQHSIWNQHVKQDTFPKVQGSEKFDSPRSCSPMDFSPYQEAVVTDNCSAGNSIFLDRLSQVDNFGSSIPGDSRAEVSHRSLDSRKGEHVYSEPTVDNTRQYVKEHLEENPVTGSATTSNVLNTEKLQNIDSIDVPFSPLTRNYFSSQSSSQENECTTQFSFASDSENLDKKLFSFTASPISKVTVSAANRRYRKKIHKKAGRNSNLNFTFGSSSGEGFTYGENVSSLDVAASQGDPSTLSDKLGDTCKGEKNVKQAPTSKTATIQEACDKFRIRGNQAYRKGFLSKAEAFYTKGINLVHSDEQSGCCLKPLLLCYSNRAAARMSRGRLRGAIGDCMLGFALDSNFYKVQLRAGNCHLLLGEVEDSLLYFNKLLESGTALCLDRKLVIEAADGVQKAQKVVDCTEHATKLLEQKTTDAAIDALRIIAEAMSISSYSEKLLKMKAEALCVLRKYEEAIQLCEQTLKFAERNFTSSQTDDTGSSECNKNSLVHLWRWNVIAKSYFFLGRLEDALELLDKLEKMGSNWNKNESKILESSISLAVTIRELLRCKNAGNEAFRSKRYAEALEHYTFALSTNVESRRFSAICFCNRAAAYQALGQIADAIADSSLAIALDGNYVKAISRRATLHEMIRDYGQAASDLRKLISVLQNQSIKESGTASTPSAHSNELKQAHKRMSLMENEAKSGISLDFYLVLGVKQSDTAADVKKAYRKAALRHHPDKAGQFLARSENKDEGHLWKEVSQEVHNDADRLFKLIGEAYAVLSDPTKRSEYDLEEEMRKAPKESSKCSFGRASDVYGHTNGRSSSRRSYQGSWKTYGSSHYRW